MNRDEILNLVPAFEEFMTVDELDKSSRELVEEYCNVKLFEIGKSEAGRPISCLKIGSGKHNALLFAFPHPNEPIGSMTIEFLARFLAENPEIANELRYTWYLIKVIDPDGAALNEGWFKGEFHPTKYAKHYYRPPPHEQIEWTFPIKYKKLIFSNPPPETQALMRLIKTTRPFFMYSLHNAGFCGVYFYVTRAIKEIFPQFIQLAKQEGLPIHQGEPESPFLKQLNPAIFQMMGISEFYDFYEKNGEKDPQELIRSGTTSADYLKRVTDDRGFTLVCEMPYFTDLALEDNSPTENDRRELVLNELKFAQDAHNFTKQRFETIRRYCDPTSRLFRSVVDRVENFNRRLVPWLQHAKTAPMYEGKATVAQAFDSNIASRFGNMFHAAMLVRLCSEASTRHPEAREELEHIGSELDHWVETTINDLLRGTNFEVIPIQKLVKVQVGSALIALEYLQGG